MPYPQLDRFALRMEPLANRTNKKAIERHVISPELEPNQLSAAAWTMIHECADRIDAARRGDRPVMLTFGAHAIKNGLARVLFELIEKGYVTHLATNGAGIIHDWEFAYQGQSCEDVESMVAAGRFGNWEETGHNINLALNVGAYRNLGYGESVGAMIESESLTIPSVEELQRAVHDELDRRPDRAAAAADLVSIVRTFDLPPGRLEIPHPWKEYSIQAGAYRLGIPLTGHPMIGHDIIYNHPMNHCASLGRTAQRDFLTFAESVSRLDGGVYISIGSAIMSPMVFEKSLSMAQNLASQRGTAIDHHFILVNDVAESTWDWSQGEPPEENPAYYLRYNKTFHRMGGTMRYLSADNRDFLLGLLHTLTGG